MIAAQLPKPIPQADFEAAWYYSIVIAAMVLLVLISVAWAVRGGARMWRERERGPGLLIAVVCVTATVGLLAMLVTGIVAIIRTGGTGA